MAFEYPRLVQRVEVKRMNRWWTKPGVHKSLALSVLAVYLFIACFVNLFHEEEYPLTTGRTAPSSDTCPACKFLAGANSIEVFTNPSLGVIELQIASITVADALIVVSRHWASSIVLRGPPSLTQA